ncbi:MAG: GDYXXLXY domain-containing protein [Alphaproteobacteria bacterium]
MNALLARWRAFGLRARALLLLSISTVFLLGMAGCEHMKRVTGEEIILRTRPVDPREILRGNYVALDYEGGESASP